MSLRSIALTPSVLDQLRTRCGEPGKPGSINSPLDGVSSQDVRFEYMDGFEIFRGGNYLKMIRLDEQMVDLCQRMF